AYGIVGFLSVEEWVHVNLEDLAVEDFFGNHSFETSSTILHKCSDVLGTICHTTSKVVDCTIIRILRLESVTACRNQVREPPAFWLASLRNSTGTVTPLVSGPGLRKIRFEKGATPIPITEAEKEELEKTGYRYFDVTEVDLEAVFADRTAQGEINRLATFPSGPTHQTQVKAIITKLSQANLQSDLAVLTAYNNRYYRSTSGATASNDLAAKLRTVGI
ncbi:hypothetical protein FRC17_002423, partial [Serendipita sp. 399]